jgi:hypothetical protein
MSASIWNPGSNIPSGGTIARAVEPKTVAAGQTVVTFSTFEYVPGTGSLFIFVAGFYYSDYVETNGTSITLNTPFTESVELVAVAGIPLNEGISGLSVSYLAPGADSVSRTVQSKLQESSFISIVDKGATPSADAFSAVQSALDSGAEIEIPAGAWSAVGTATVTGSKIIKARNGSVLSGSAFSNLGFYTGGNGIEQNVHQGGGPVDSASFYFRRETNYAGGTPGYVNSAVRAETYVRNPASTSFEWTSCFVLHNFATGGENVAGYRQGIKYTGAGPTWAGCDEIIDWNINPTSGVVGTELSFTANGTDNNRVRVAYDVALRKRSAAGASPTLTWGYRIQTEAGSTVDRGYGFAPGASVLKAFDTTEATVLQSALSMADGQAITFNTLQTKKLFYDGVGLKYENAAGVLGFRANDTGVLQVGNINTAATVPGNFIPNRIIQIQQRDGTSLYIPAMLATW